MRLALAAGAVLLLAACGGNVDKPQPAGSAHAHALEPAPAIEAIDEPGSALAFESYDNSYDETVLCLSFGPSTEPPQSTTTKCDLSAEELERHRQEDEAYYASIRPAPGHEPRAIARLTLGDGEIVTFSVWRNRRGEVCTYTETRVADGSSGGGGGDGCGPHEPHCSDICLSTMGTEIEPGTTYWVFSGLVAGRATAIRLTQERRGVRVFPLTGPIVDGTNRRVLLLDLGTDDWRRVELLYGDQVMATNDSPDLGD